MVHALHEIVASTGGSFDSLAFASSVVHNTRELLSCDSAALYMWSPENETLECLVASDGLVVESPPILSGRGVSRQALLTLEPVTVDDYPSWEHALPSALASGLKSCAAVPLVVGGRPLGVLVVRSFHPRHWTNSDLRLLSLFATQVAPTLELVRLYSESERRRTETEALAEMVRLGARERDIDRVLAFVCEQAGPLLKADYGGISLREAGGGHAVRVGMWGNREPYDSRRASRGRGTGPLALSMSEDRTVILESLTDDPELTPAFHLREGGRTALATPLRTHQGVIGALSLGWRSVVKPSAEQVKLAEALASYAATVVENARGYAQEQEARAASEATAAVLLERERALQTLHELAVATGGVLNAKSLGQLVVDGARDLLGVDSAGLRLWDPETNSLLPIADSEIGRRGNPAPLLHAAGIQGLVFSTGKPVVVDDYMAWRQEHGTAVERGIRSAVAVPLRVGERSVGTLLVRSYTKRRFEPEQVQFLELLAAQVAPPLEAARLHEESEKRREEAEALADLVRLGAQERDSVRAMDLICDRARRLIGADYAGMALVQRGQRIWHGISGSQVMGREIYARSSSQGITAQALTAGKTLVFEHLDRQPELSDAHTAEGGHTATATPIVAHGDLTGALHLGWRHDVAPTPSQIRLAEAIASYAGVILENARAHADLEERAQVLAASQERLRTLYEALACGVVVWGPSGTITHANAAAEELFARTQDELLGQAPDDLWMVVEAEGEMAAPVKLSQAILNTRQALRKVTISTEAADGPSLWLQADVVPVLNADGSIEEVVASFIDVTARMEAEQALARQALYDELTGLPNRRLLEDRLDQAILGSLRGGYLVGILLLDLDGFKSVNDTLGHQAGDVVLRKVGERARAALRTSDTVARLGGDEFAVVLTSVTDGPGAEVAAAKILAALREPTKIGGKQVVVGASIGIALCPMHGRDRARLLHCADVAMYAAKNAGSGAELYEPYMERREDGELLIGSTAER